MTEEAAAGSVSKRALREFGLMFGAMLALMFGGVLPWLFDYPVPAWPFIAAGVFVIVATLVPALLAPVYQLWMRFAGVLGWINTRIILFLVFVGLFLPLGLLLRLFGVLQFEHRWRRDAASYRVQRKATRREDLEVPF